MAYMYNEDLAKRFVSDYKLPIQLTNEKYFKYFLNLYDKDYGSMQKYMKLCQLIEDKYYGSPKLFLEKYYETRDNIIKTVENSEAYQKFNTMDMSAYIIKNKKNITSNNIYKEGNIGRMFVSIDLKKANFQALKYVNPEIVMNAETYQDFIKKFTDSDYIAESKYCRQVIWGKLNPKRHITVEKYIIDQIYEYLVGTDHVENCVSMSNDEIVFDLGKAEEHDYADIAGLCTSYELIRQFIKVMLGFDVSVELFILHGVQLCCEKFKRSCYYYKEYLNNTGSGVKGKLMCVPMNYFAIVYKLFNNVPLQEEDYHFDYEGLDCRYCEDFHILTDYKDEGLSDGLFNDIDKL